MGSPRYFKVQFRLKDFFVSVAYVALAMTFVRLSIWLTGTLELPKLALFAQVGASLSFGAAVGTLFRIPAWGALVGLGIYVWTFLPNMRR